MSPGVRDLLTGAALLVFFPASIHLTHAASSEPGSPGEPTPEPAPVTKIE